MFSSRGWLVCATWCGLTVFTPISAAAATRPLQVAVKQAPPFSLRGDNGEWTGTSIELWQELAAELELDYRYHETSLDDMIQGVGDGRYDVAVAALTVTAQREEVVDFTHPYYTTGLAIGVQQRPEHLWAGVVSTVFSFAFLELISVLACIQLAVGTAVWLVERRANPNQFPPSSARGLFSGFWWATVTMTTVGYGDEVPRSALGRVIALSWMLVSMILIASVTGTIASSLTLERLDERIRGPEDLHRFSVGTI
ncbi:MAG: transporter substrate-binding domain-containing protein, partial [Nannocystaceae bacterium]